MFTSASKGLKGLNPKLKILATDVSILRQNCILQFLGRKFRRFWRVFKRIRSQTVQWRRDAMGRRGAPRSAAERAGQDASFIGWSKLTWEFVFAQWTGAPYIRSLPSKYDTCQVFSSSDSILTRARCRSEADNLQKHYIDLNGATMGRSAVFRFSAVTMHTTYFYFLIILRPANVWLFFEKIEENSKK